MYPTHSIVYSTREERFSRKFPLSIVATIAVIQMLTTFAIFALEIGHNILHMKLTNLFVGFWTTVPFTVLWISMFSVGRKIIVDFFFRKKKSFLCLFCSILNLVCCCRRQSCATHAVIQNILGLIFAGILIFINSNFIQHPNKCFFSDGICGGLTWTSYITEPIECLVDGRASGCGNARISLIIGQLFAGILMALSCIIYLIIYSVVFYRTSKAKQCPAMKTPETAMSTLYSTNSKSIPMAVSHHHHQTYAYANPMPIYPSQTGTLCSDGNYMNYITPNPYSTIYPYISNERF